MCIGGAAMARFEKIRSDAIKEMSKADFKAFELDEKSEHIKERAEKLQEGISGIPHDLPEELQQQIDAVCQKAQSDVRAEAKSLAEDAYEAQADADKALDRTRQDSDDLKKKGEKLSGLRDVPLIGAFADAKSRELAENSGQLSDIATETQKHSDKLAKIRNKLSGI